MKFPNWRADMNFSPKQLAIDAHGTWINFSPEVPITNFAIDSRKATHGSLFFAIPTDKDDGHRYLAAALANGACGAVVEQYDESIAIPQLIVSNSISALQSAAKAHRQRYLRPVIAVAGSYGKTTTKELLALLLGKSETLSSAGNENNTLGVPLTLLRLDPGRHRYAVLETGISRPGEMSAISGILQPTHVIFTAISQKHLEFFTSQVAILEEKLRICEAVLLQNGFIVTGEELAKLPQFTPFRNHLCVVSLGCSRQIGALAYIPRLENGKMFCRIIFSGSEITGEDYELPVPSAGFAYDFAICRAITRHFGISQETTTERLAQWKPLPLRGQAFRHRKKKQTYFVDCYNSDAPALIESVRIFEKKFPNVPRYYIIGSLSEYGVESERQHRLVGEQLQIGAHERILFIGKECVFVRDALKWRNVPPQNMHICRDLDEIRAAICDVEGAIYLKGSRMHGLERLVDFDECELLDAE